MCIRDSLRMVRGDYGQDCEGGDHAVEPLRLCLLRFLRGNDFCVNKAFSQVGRFQVSAPGFHADLSPVASSLDALTVPPCPQIHGPFYKN